MTKYLKDMNCGSNRWRDRAGRNLINYTRQLEEHQGQTVVGTLNGEDTRSPKYIEIEGKIERLKKRLSPPDMIFYIEFLSDRLKVKMAEFEWAHVSFDDLKKEMADIAVQYEGTNIMHFTAMSCKNWLTIEHQVQDYMYHNIGKRWFMESDYYRIRRGEIGIGGKVVYHSKNMLQLTNRINKHRYLRMVG